MPLNFRMAYSPDRPVATRYNRNRAAGGGTSRSPFAHLLLVRSSTPSKRAAAICDSPSCSIASRYSSGVTCHPRATHQCSFSQARNSASVISGSSSCGRYPTCRSYHSLRESGSVVSTLGHQGIGIAQPSLFATNASTSFQSSESKRTSLWSATSGSACTVNRGPSGHSRSDVSA